MNLLRKHKKFLKRTKLAFLFVLIVVCLLPILYNHYYTGTIELDLSGFLIIVLTAFAFFVLPAWLISMLEVIEFEQTERFNWYIIKQSIVPALVYTIGFMMLGIFFQYGVGALIKWLIDDHDIGLLLAITYLYHVLLIYLFICFRK